MLVFPPFLQNTAAYLCLDIFDSFLGFLPSCPHRIAGRIRDRSYRPIFAWRTEEKAIPGEKRKNKQTKSGDPQEACRHFSLPSSIHRKRKTKQIKLPAVSRQKGWCGPSRNGLIDEASCGLSITGVSFSFSHSFIASTHSLTQPFQKSPLLFWC